jgi:hypothetical protein
MFIFVNSIMQNTINNIYVKVFVKEIIITIVNVGFFLSLHIATVDDLIF